MSEKILGNFSKGRLFVVSAPSGTGKSTLVDMLTHEFSDCVVRSRSSTTREPRGHEKQGVDYDFITRAEFEKEDDFLEKAEIYGNLYGTKKSVIERYLNAGKHVVLVIDTQGAMNIKKKMKACFIFISPPSAEELEKRLTNRHTEDKATIERRLEWSKKEMTMVGEYDYNLVNDDLEITYQIFRSIFIAEEHKTNGKIDK